MITKSEFHYARERKFINLFILLLNQKSENLLARGSLLVVKNNLRGGASSLFCTSDISRPDVNIKMSAEFELAPIKS